MSILSFATHTSHLKATSLTSSVASAHSPRMLSYINCEDTGFFTLPSFAGQTEIWLSYTHSTSFGVSNPADIVTFSGNGTPLWRVRAASGSVYLEQWNGTVWVDTGVAPYAMTTGKKRYDIRLRIADAGGAFEFWEDRVQRLAFAGDTLLTAQTTVDTVSLVTIDNVGGGFSACFVADEDSKLIEAQQVKPTGNGFHTAWAGDYTNVDEVGPPDSLFINTSVPNDIETYTKSAIDTGLNSGYEIISIGVNAYGRRGAGGPNNLQLVSRSGTTDAVGATLALGIADSAHQSFFAVNPATASPWDFTALNASQIGVKAIA